MWVAAAGHGIWLLAADDPWPIKSGPAVPDCWLWGLEGWVTGGMS